MGEIIQIHVGQAGVQIANACWELYCLEHGIRSDGSLCNCPCDTTFSSFFAFKDSDKVVPRAVLVDSEPTVIDQIRTGPYGQLYSPTSLITGKEDSGSNYARGYYTMGRELIDITMEAIRTTVESCSNLKGFLTFRSIGGGTGSGLGNLIAERIQEDYEKSAKMEFIIFPSPSISPLIVEPYNALLATHFGMDSVDCTFILDNEALYDICASKLHIIAPKYKNLNRIIGQIVSTFTTSQRFAGSSNVSFVEFQTNLVPYPRIHFPIVSYAPFIPGTVSGSVNCSTEQITNACYEPFSQLVRCNPAEGKYMSTVLLYRGNVSLSEINGSILQLRTTKKLPFVDWSPTGFKVGLNREPPFSVPGGGVGHSDKALVTLSNNTIIQKAWCRLIGKYDRLYSRRAFIHHYIADGLDEDSLREASEDICVLISDYREVDISNDLPSMKADENKSTKVPSVENLALPQLPGLQSLNYFFGDSNYPDDVESLKPNATSGTDISFKSGATVCERTTLTQDTGSLERVNKNGNECMQVLNAKSVTKSVNQDNLSDKDIFEISEQQLTQSPPKECEQNICERKEYKPKKCEQRKCEQNKFEPKEDEPTQSEPKKCEQKEYEQTQFESTKCEPTHNEPNKFERTESYSLVENKRCQKFDQGFDTEAVRAKEKHSRLIQQSESLTKCQCKCAKQYPGQKMGERHVLRLPPKCSEGKEYLGEAVSAKQRFENSTFQAPSTSKYQHFPCSTQSRFDDQKPSCVPRKERACQKLSLPNVCPKPSHCCPKPDKGCVSPICCAMQPTRCNLPKAKSNRCFCCQDSDPMMFINSDNKLPPMCSRPQGHECRNKPVCFCDDDSEGAFDISSAIVEPLQCCPSQFIVCNPEEEVICCLSDDRSCECYPECTSNTRSMVFQRRQSSEN